MAPKNLIQVEDAPSWLYEDVKKEKARDSRFTVIKSSKKWGGKRQEALGRHIRKKKDAIEAGWRKLAEWEGLVKVEVPKEMVRFETIADEVIDFLESGLESGDSAEKTVTSAKLHLRKHLIPWFNQNCPYVQDLNEVVCNEDYVSAQRKKDPERYLGNDIKYLRRVVKRAFQKKLIPQKFELHTIDEDDDNSPGLFIPLEEQARLTELEYQKDGRPKLQSLRMRVKVLMGLTQGMRNKETTVVEWPQIHRDVGIIKLRAEQTKNREARDVPITPQVAAALDALLSELNARGLPATKFVHPARLSKPKGMRRSVWTDYQRSHIPQEPVQSHKAAWRTLKARAKVSYSYRFHDTRVTYLTTCGALGLPADLVCRGAGLSPEVYRRRYLKPTTEHMKKIATQFGAEWERIHSALNKIGGKLGGEQNV